MRCSSTLPSRRRQLTYYRLVQLDFQVEQAVGAAVDAAQYYAAVHQPDRRKGALLDNPQQQRELVALHGARHGHQHFLGLATLAVQFLQLGVYQVTGVPGRPQRRLQGLGAQLPPEAGVDIPGLQAGGSPGRVAKAILLVHQQGIARTLQVSAAVPQLEVAVVDVQ